MDIRHLADKLREIAIQRHRLADLLEAIESNVVAISQSDLDSNAITTVVSSMFRLAIQSTNGISQMKRLQIRPRHPTQRQCRSYSTRSETGVSDSNTKPCRNVQGTCCCCNFR